MPPNPPITARPNPPRRSLFATLRWPRWVLVVVVGLFVAYPLSVGPLIWLEKKGLSLPRPVTDALEIMYVPVFMVAECGPQPVRNAFHWYLRFWKNL